MNPDLANGDLESEDYDEFAGLEEVAREWGLGWDAAPRVVRRDVEVAPGQTVSALVWGEVTPDVVFVHGGGQNAHTWDAVALALGRPAVAFDLPGHGRSSWRADRDYSPLKNAEALKVALPALAPNARTVVGMSLGGLTDIRLAAIRPDLVKSVVIVDVTPQVTDRVQQMSRAGRGTAALTGGPQAYDTFEAMVQAAIALGPNRSADSVRRGVRHNARRLADGRWGWRHDLSGLSGRLGSDLTRLWRDVSCITAPAMLIIGGESAYVTNEDVAEMRRRAPGLRVETIAGAGHAVQSDQPLDLARLIEDFAFSEH